MHKILSQVEILGSPIMLGSSLISGLSTFLAEPAKARNPAEFARGVGTGSVTLVKMASFGILTFIGQVIVSLLGLAAPAWNSFDTFRQLSNLCIFWTRHLCLLMFFNVSRVNDPRDSCEVHES